MLDASTLFRDHIDYARSVAIRLRRSYTIQRDLWEDVEQWCLIGLHRASLLWNGSGTFKGYAFMLMKSEVVDGLRGWLGRNGSRNYHLLSDDEWEVHDTNNCVHDTHVEAETVDLISTCRRVLTERELQSILPDLDADVLKQDVAHSWGLTAARVAQIRRQAIPKLQRALKDAD